MAAKNPVTGDAIIHMPTKAFEDNYDRIFRNKDKVTETAVSMEETLERLPRTIHMQLPSDVADIIQDLGSAWLADLVRKNTL